LLQTTVALLEGHAHAELRPRYACRVELLSPADLSVQRSRVEIKTHMWFAGRLHANAAMEYALLSITVNGECQQVHVRQMDTLIAFDGLPAGNHTVEVRIVHHKTMDPFCASGFEEFKRSGAARRWHNFQEANDGSAAFARIEVRESSDGRQTTHPSDDPVAAYLGSVNDTWAPYLHGVAADFGRYSRCGDSIVWVVLSGHGRTISSNLPNLKSFLSAMPCHFLVLYTRGSLEAPGETADQPPDQRRSHPTWVSFFQLTSRGASSTKTNGTRTSAICTPGHLRSCRQWQRTTARHCRAGMWCCFRVRTCSTPTRSTSAHCKPSA
jgi:hypothetical protein